MTRTVILAAGVLLALMSVGTLALAIGAGRGALGRDVAWLGPLLGTGGAVAAGLGLVAAALLIGVGMGRWERPSPVPTPEARRGEGLQE